MDLDLLKDLIRHCSSGSDAVLATIIRASGSTPRDAGTQMLVYPDGRISGTVGGGGGEEIVRNTALEMLKNRQPYKKITLELNADIQAQEGMICGGSQELFLELVAGK